MTPLVQFEHELLDPFKGLGTKTMGQEIISESLKRSGVSRAELFSDKRHKHIVCLRQQIYYRLYHELHLNLSQIGRLMKRDHTTVSTGLRRYEDLKFYWNKRNENVQRNPG